MITGLAIAGGVVLIVGAAVVSWLALGSRARVRGARWLLVRAGTVLDETRRASLTVGGLQLVDELRGGVARDRETDADASG